MATEDLDLLCVGETLVDFISTEPANSLSEADQFRRYLGGSPANIAVTLARLGGRAAIASRVGSGAFGRSLRREIEGHGVVTDYLHHDPQHRTTMVFVTRTQGTPDFEVVHGADANLQPEDIPDSAITRSRLIHASTFALSRQPSRDTVADALRRAAGMGKLVSLDPNYSPLLWPDIDEARAVLAELYAYATITKPSLDDAGRLFGEGKTPEAYIDHFHALGPRTVVLTLGKQGTLLSHEGVRTHIPARLVQVVDATGAGDSFWGGFLMAWLDGKTPEQAVRIASAVVALKLQGVGHGSGPIDKAAIYREIEGP